MISSIGMMSKPIYGKMPSWWQPNHQPDSYRSPNPILWENAKVMATKPPTRSWILFFKIWTSIGMMKFPIYGNMPNSWQPNHQPGNQSTIPAWHYGRHSRRLQRLGVAEGHQALPQPVDAPDLCDTLKGGLEQRTWTQKSTRWRWLDVSQYNLIG